MLRAFRSYARMFLGQMNKPDLDSIDGLSPAVSIDRKPRRAIRDQRSVRQRRYTITCACFYARVGVPHCPECGREIKRQTTDQVTDDILSLADEGGNPQSRYNGAGGHGSKRRVHETVRRRAEGGFHQSPH